MSIRRRPRIRRAALTASAAALTVLALSACGSGENSGGGDKNAGEGTLDVAASFYPMAFLAERIGGEHASVRTLTGPGVDPHDLELSPRETARLTEADVIVHLEGLQPAVDDAIAQSGVEHIAEATSFTSLETHGNEPEGHSHGEHEGEEHEHGEHEGEEHEHGEHEGEEHGGHGHEHEDGQDPHVWLDPVKFAEIAEGVGTVLAEADPGHAAAYERNTGELVADLHALDEEFAEGLAVTETATFFTTHAAFGHLAARYGLHEESVTGLDPESGPSAARMAELHEIAEEDDVRTVFSEPLASGGTARTLAGDLGLETGVLDPLEGLTDASPGDGYFEVMRANLDALRAALGTA